ncbi:MAG: peptidase M14, partial [candidate division Zixibacteria bacterium]|nr:peptidase M14 [candidate division Zixibacteria bacterium]
MLKTLTFLMLMLIVFAPVAQAADFDNDLTTYYEKSNFLETPRYDETVAFCKLLEAESPFVKYTSFGITPQGRELPLLIVDKSESFAPPTDDRIVLLVIACIHPGESDGKDAGLVLIRDLIRDDSLTKQFDDVVLLFIPIFNVDGHERFGPYNRINQNGPLEMGFRVTAQGYNLNRDFLKADSPEMRAWLKLFREWLPDFFIDCHVTDGADYQYTITYGLETHENMPEP